jgi:hypothetical protein
LSTSHLSALTQSYYIASQTHPCGPSHVAVVFSQLLPLLAPFIGYNVNASAKEAHPLHKPRHTSRVTLHSLCLDSGLSGTCPFVRTILDVTQTAHSHLSWARTAYGPPHISEYCPSLPALRTTLTTRETPHNQLHHPIIWPLAGLLAHNTASGTTVHSSRPVSGRRASCRIDASTPIRQTRSARSSRGRHGRYRDGPYTNCRSSAPETPQETVNIQLP